MIWLARRRSLRSPARPGRLSRCWPCQRRRGRCSGVAVEGALDLWEQMPPGVHRAPLPLPVQHVGKPRFDPKHLRAQTLAGWHPLAGIELRLAAQAMEALALGDADYQAMLAEQCARVGQLYSELKRRAGMSVALAMLRGDLRLLRYRESPALAGLAYD